MLELTDVCIRLGTNLLIDGCSFKVQRGEIVSLHGQNGSGKTTLLRTILAISPLNKGQILINGLSLGSLNRKRIATLVGYLPQSITPPLGTLAEQLIDDDVSPEIFERFGIAALINKDYYDLSGGERQRLLLSAVLREDLKLLILDEPLKSLDREFSAILGDILKKYASGGTAIFMTNHDSHWTSWYADRKLQITERKVLECQL